MPCFVLVSLSKTGLLKFINCVLYSAVCLFVFRYCLYSCIKMETRKDWNVVHDTLAHMITLITFPVIKYVQKFGSKLGQQLSFSSQSVRVGSWLLSSTVKQDLCCISAWHVSLIPRNSFLWGLISINPHGSLKKSVRTTHFNNLFSSLTESEQSYEMPGTAILLNVSLQQR